MAKPIEKLGVTPHGFRLPDVFETSGSERPKLIVHNIAKDTPAHMSIGFSKHALSVVLTGNKLLLDRGKRLEIDDGSALLYCAGSDFVTWDSQDYTSYLVFFTSTELGAFLQEQNIRQPITASEGCLNRFTAGPALSSRLSHLHDHETRYGAPSKEMRIKILHMILLEILQTQGPDVFQCLLNTKDLEASEKIRSVLQASWNTNKTIEDIAAQVHMSRASFVRVVRKIYGISPGDWIAERRMAAAWHLLVFSGKRPSQVADMLGYASHSAFSQTFRKHFGTPPSMARLPTSRQKLSG